MLSMRSRREKFLEERVHFLEEKVKKLQTVLDNKTFEEQNSMGSHFIVISDINKETFFAKCKKTSQVYKLVELKKETLFKTTL